MRPATQRPCSMNTPKRLPWPKPASPTQPSTNSPSSALLFIHRGRGVQRRASVDPLVRPLWDKRVDASTGAHRCIDEAPSMRRRSPVVVRPVFRLFGNPDAPAPDVEPAPLLPGLTGHSGCRSILGPRGAWRRFCGCGCRRGAVPCVGTSCTA